MSLWPEMATAEFALKTVDAGGVRTRYLEAGRPDAPVVVFIHGTGGHLETFNRSLITRTRSGTTSSTSTTS